MIEREAPYTLWGGRFREPLSPRAMELLTSLGVDRHLLRWDLMGSLAHVVSMAEADAIPIAAARELIQELRAMVREASEGAGAPESGYEDIHSYVNAELEARLGPVAGWLHTGRSRNDQVVTAFRLFLKESLCGLARRVAILQGALLDRADEAGGLVVPGYTHLQRAQPVLLAHLWLSYFWMLGRDLRRIRGALATVDVCPLGSGALAGTGFRVDRNRQARLLGFAGVTENSIDATGDRDFAFEAATAVCGLLLHLSRWAEELVLWSSHEFGFVSLPDGASTGSSLMPQKKNPDLLELVRAQAGVAIGQMVVLAAVLKGVPSGYNRDLQEDKAPVVAFVAAAKMALDSMILVAQRLTIESDRIREALRGGYMTATEVADYLVKSGVPFRDAHHLAGRVVLEAEAAGRELWELPIEAYRSVYQGFGEDVLDSVTVEGAVRAKDVTGGTAPGRVAEALRAARSSLSVHRSWIDSLEADSRVAQERLMSVDLT